MGRTVFQGIGLYRRASLRNESVRKGILNGNWRRHSNMRNGSRMSSIYWPVSAQFPLVHSIGARALGEVPYTHAQSMIASFSSRAKRDHEAWGRGKSPYKILEVSPTASQKEIKIAYFKAAKKHHPDVNPDDEEGARARFQFVSAAYELLSDESKRRKYDSTSRASAWSGSGNRQQQGAANDWKRRQEQADGFNAQQWQHQTSSYNNYARSDEFFHYVTREDLDVIKQAWADYEKEMKEDIEYAGRLINKGELRKAASVLSEYTGLIVGIGIPVAAFLRFPALIALVSTFLFRFGFYILITVATDYYGIWRMIWKFFVRRAQNRSARRAKRREE